MAFLDKIKGNPFERVKKEELTAERIRLERTEKLKIAEVEKLAEQKKTFFNKGFDSGESERRTLARKIQQLDHKIKLGNIHLKKVSDQIRVIDNMIFIQENKRMLEEKGLTSKLLKMPSTKLDEYLSKVNIEQQISDGNVNQLLQTMEAEYGLMGDVSDDKETKELMDIWSTSDASEADDVFQQWDKEKSAQMDEDLEEL